ncbi:uncharacterized protein LOC122878814 [Xyrichtys novacula]|uniref:Uncharacterized protein LOC122878814 n=1 Tax=Xyrichtys novacula TaxID=13765 RepID=A0AAV1EJP9_XYRNO|nr:uncharacterized protein LOC122878814 [Xyrichtys novacula]
MAVCAQSMNRHAETLMINLNHQRQRAQFCDCVVIQKLNPGQVFSAHRCVLSAASPVLASILSSTGVLVELHDPCLSGSVLGMLLDYIYTGSIMHTHSQEQFCSLLTAATYLQMDGLQETLRALQQTEVKAVDDADGIDYQPNKHIRDEDNASCSGFRAHMPLSHTCLNSLQEEDHSDATHLGTCNDNCDKDCPSKGNTPSRNVIASCSAPRITNNGLDTDNCTQVTHLTSQDSSEKFPFTFKTSGVPTVDKELSKDQPSNSAESQTCQEEDLARSVPDRRGMFYTCTAVLQEKEMSEENRKQPCLAVKGQVEAEEMNREEVNKTQIHLSPVPSLSTSTVKDSVSHSQCTSLLSSSSPQPCSEAVSVICHSSNASMSQLTEESSKIPCLPVLKVSASSCCPSRSIDGDSTAEGITISHGIKNQELNHKSNSSAGHQHSSNVSSQTANQNDHSAHCDSFHNQPKDRRDKLEQRTRLCRNLIRGLKNKTDLGFEDFPSKYQRLDCSDNHNIPTKSIHSNDQRVEIPLPEQSPVTGSVHHSEGSSPEREVKEEHKHTTKVQRQDSNCSLHRPRTDWCPNVRRAEAGTKDDSVSKSTTIMDQNIIDVCPSVPTTPESSLGETGGGLSVFERHTSQEFERISNQMSDDNTSDHTSGDVAQAYHGHIHYHCMTPERLSNRDSDHKPPDHSDPSVDENVSTFQDQGTLRQHFVRQTTERVVLLDISAKPAELLVTYKHRSEGGETWVAFDHKDRENNDRDRWDEETPAAVVDERNCKGLTNLEAESFDGAETKYWAGEANVPERQSVGKDQSSPVAKILYKTGTMTVCSQPTGSEFVQGPVSFTSPDSIPLSPSAIMATNKSPPLSTPTHHSFQCYLCDRSFSQRGSLNRHVRSHLGVRPFPCPNCPMSFSRQYRVTEHMRVHQRCSLGTDFQKPSASPT